MQCPKCLRTFDENSEQAISIEFHQECVACRFTPKSAANRGSGSGTDEELEVIRLEHQKRANAQKVDVQVVAKKGHTKECAVCKEEKVFMTGYVDKANTKAHNLFHCHCGVICREDVHPVKQDVWLAPTETTCSITTPN